MIQGKELKILAIKSLVVMVLWTVIILLISSITFLSFMQEGFSMGVFEVIIYEFLCISPWILFTPVIVWLARAYRFESSNFIKSLGIHLGAAAVVFSMHSVVQSYTNSFYYETVFSLAYIQRDFLGFLDMRVMLYVGILLAVYAIDFHRKNREIRLTEPRLRAELNKAKFHALLNQIQPEFLLNSIESIKLSLDRNKEQSEEILTEFSDLLRIMLANVNKEEVSIKEDLESYYLYTNIIQKRLGLTISVQEDIEEECYDAMVPSFLMLIPVFEEIINYINPPNQVIQRICYIARRVSDKTHLEAIIEGKNIPSKEIPKILRKVGFSGIIEKLQSKYGDNVEFKTKTGTDYICISFEMPYMVSEGSAGPLVVNGRIESLAKSNSFNK